jgi:hypothetical protein
VAGVTDFPTTAQEHFSAVTAWVRETCPAIIGWYDYATPGKDMGLPDVVVEVELFANRRNDERFPYAQMQQVLVRVYDMVVSIMVDDTDPRGAALALRAFAGTIADAVLADASLGGRVFLASPELEADFVPQFVVYEDGVRGRQVQIRLAVAQLVQEDA